jgi:signal transduction histidine kinase
VSGVAEALVNVAKYSQASRATVAVSHHGGLAVVEVADDGIGGADLTRGSGLRGLADRIGALGGELEVDSPHGAGTTIRATIPCGLSAPPRPRAGAPTDAYYIRPA